MEYGQSNLVLLFFIKNNKNKQRKLKPQTSSYV